MVSVVRCGVVSVRFNIGYAFEEYGGVIDH